MGNTRNWQNRGPYRDIKCLQKKNRTQGEFKFIGNIARIFVGDSSSYATMGHLAAYNWVDARLVHVHTRNGPGRGIQSSTTGKQFDAFGRFIVQYMAILIGVSSDSIYIVLIPIQGRNKMSPRLISRILTPEAEKSFHFRSSTLDSPLHVSTQFRLF